MQIAILGAGAWGTALAVIAAARTQAPLAVSLWARDAVQLDVMRRHCANQRYLPDVQLPQTLELRQWPDQGDAALTAFASASLVVVATPMAALRDMLAVLRNCPAPVVWLCKGFEQIRTGADAVSSPWGLMAHEVQAQVAPALRAGVLSGPSFAQEIAQGKPAALVAASEHADVRSAMVAAFHGPMLRVYASEDVVGVEVGGAVKNVLAIATGLCDGLHLGLNARA
ncbi:MAG: NAD(P)H-dependent glycerol-3-phosphate dehydrogenase, partial [Betaproteobacteria bacterium]